MALRGAGGPLPPLLLGPYTCEEKTGILQNSCLPRVEHAAFPAVRQKGVASGLLFQCYCHPTAEMATPSLLNFVLCLWFRLPLFLSVDVFVVSPPPLTRPAFCKMAPGQGWGGGRCLVNPSLSCHCFLEESGGGRDVGKVLYGWINKMTWKIHTRTPWCWCAQGWNESVTAGEDGWGVRTGNPQGLWKWQ